jgi:hypothetical protein
VRSREDASLDDSSLDGEALADRALHAIEAEFEASPGGVYRQRFGAAGKDAAFSQKKVCFVATDKPFLVRLVHRLSLRPDCHWVKYSCEPRDGMYLARCFMTNDDAAGRLCFEYKKHPKLMVALQDDEFAERFRRS